MSSSPCPVKLKKYEFVLERSVNLLANLKAYHIFPEPQVKGVSFAWDPAQMPAPNAVLLPLKG